MHKSRMMLLSAALLAPLVAGAQQAQTTRWVQVRAGPAREYPLVMQLPPNAPVSVQGCLSDYSWCDVITLDNGRGWVYGGSLVYPYQNGNVQIIEYGPRIGLPVVSFFLVSYWGSYYRERAWYGDRNRWDTWHHQHVGPGHRPPPPPYRPDARPPRPPVGAIRPPPPLHGNVRPPPPPRPATRPAPRPRHGDRVGHGDRGDPRPQQR
jgi:uncharacterized protein YraI